MADTRKDGGPAFPRTESDYDIGQRGMTLRDWFMGSSITAATSIVINYMPESNPKFHENVAHHAGLLADAMLKECDK